MAYEGHMKGAFCWVLQVTPGWREVKPGLDLAQTDPHLAADRSHHLHSL